MRFVVSGDSMAPTYPAGSKLFVSKIAKFRAGNVVVLRDPRDGRQILKRIKSENQNGHWVEGDNASESTDSRQFGPVKREDIIGRAMFKYPRNKEVWLVMLVILFAAIGLIDSLYLTYAHYQQGGLAVCGSGAGGCNAVTTSEYSSIFGVSLAILGVGFYALVLVLVWLYRRSAKYGISRVLMGWTTIGFVTSLYLTYIQAFVIHSFCRLCLTSAISSTLIFLSTLLLARRDNNKREARV